MIVAKTIAECRHARSTLGKLAFVPTMGALHAGHESLMHLAKAHAPATATSIFVNPTQFGPNEDFTRYPRPIDADLQICQRQGVDLVFMPEAAEVYRPDLPETVIDFPSLTGVLDGLHRPGHFRGVCQVVAKLFNIVQPNVAIFGQKDFQQLQILSAMVFALDFPIKIVAAPTVREADGLAMSSRNRYLSPADRERGLSISRGLFKAVEAHRTGQKDARTLIAIVTAELVAQSLQIDYVAVVDQRTLQSVNDVGRPSVIAVAARVGSTRLIDNVRLG